MKYTLILVILLALLSLYLVFGHNGVLKYSEMAETQQKYEETISEMDKRINKLQEELSLAKKDKEYLENVIRRDLGMQKEGEDLYLIQDNKSDKK